MAKLSPFDFLKSINSSKENLLEDPENNVSDYVPFVVNRSLSYFLDTVLYANEMNIYHELDNDLQFMFLLHSIRPRKRFAKWVKPIVSEDIKLIQDAYGYNAQLATQVLSFLSPEDLEMIRNIKEVGGNQSVTRVSK